MTKKKLATEELEYYKQVVLDVIEKSSDKGCKKFSFNEVLKEANKDVNGTDGIISVIQGLYIGFDNPKTPIEDLVYKVGYYQTCVLHGAYLKRKGVKIGDILKEASIKGQKFRDEQITAIFAEFGI